MDSFKRTNPDVKDQDKKKADLPSWKVGLGVLRNVIFN